MKTFFRHHEWVDWGVWEREKESARLAKYKKIINKLFFLSLTLLRLTNFFLIHFFLLLAFPFWTRTHASSVGWLETIYDPRACPCEIFIFCFGFFCAHLVDCWCGKFRWVHEGFFTSKNITFHPSPRPKVPHFNNFSIFSSSSSSLAIFFHAEIKNSIGSQRCWLYSCENLSRLDSG